MTLDVNDRLAERCLQDGAEGRAEEGEHMHDADRETAAVHPGSKEVHTG